MINIYFYRKFQTLDPCLMKKIALILLLLSNAALAQRMVKNGAIYKEHPYIDIVKMLAELYEKGDANGMAKYYADTVHIYGMTRYSPDTGLMEKHLLPKSKALIKYLSEGANRQLLLKTEITESFIISISCCAYHGPC